MSRSGLAAQAASTPLVPIRAAIRPVGAKGRPRLSVTTCVRVPPAWAKLSTALAPIWYTPSTTSPAAGAAAVGTPDELHDALLRSHENVHSLPVLSFAAALPIGVPSTSHVTPAALRLVAVVVLPKADCELLPISRP